VDDELLVAASVLLVRLRLGLGARWSSRVGVCCCRFGMGFLVGLLVLIYWLVWSALCGCGLGVVVLFLGWLPAGENDRLRNPSY